MFCDTNLSYFQAFNWKILNRYVFRMKRSPTISKNFLKNPFGFAAIEQFILRSTYSSCVKCAKCAKSVKRCAYVYFLCKMCKKVRVCLPLMLTFKCIFLFLIYFFVVGAILKKGRNILKIKLINMIFQRKLKNITLKK